MILGRRPLLLGRHPFNPQRGLGSFRRLVVERYIEALLVLFVVFLLQLLERVAAERGARRRRYPVCAGAG